MRWRDQNGSETDGREPPDLSAALPGTTAGPARPSTGRRGRPASARVGAVLAATVVVVGSAATALAAHQRAQADSATAARSFVATSAEVASTLQLAIERETDLAADTGAFLLGRPNVSNSVFGQWTSAAQVTARYPEVQSMGELVIVPAASLPAYRARVTADPVGALSSTGVFAIA